MWARTGNAVTRTAANSRAPRWCTLRRCDRPPGWVIPHHHGGGRQFPCRPGSCSYHPRTAGNRGSAARRPSRRAGASRRCPLLASNPRSLVRNGSAAPKANKAFTNTRGAVENYTSAGSSRRPTRLSASWWTAFANCLLEGLGDAGLPPRRNSDHGGRAGLGCAPLRDPSRLAGVPNALRAWMSPPDPWSACCRRWAEAAMALPPLPRTRVHSGRRR